ncbi:hypothetical protein F506_17795 [Herbaspirillum hiltneri N3]|uniref:Uncharacterized protein n=1 Tax=Herbaspirillum hiltneri N3 TaxID=1262470 RepID=A0ABM5V3S3_9BURK|nr:hypothetical protein F506_17795 [Herbaspirillum hiltneri N3]
MPSAFLPNVLACISDMFLAIKGGVSRKSVLRRGTKLLKELELAIFDGTICAILGRVGMYKMARLYTSFRN